MWQELQPSLARVGRLEELVSWWMPVQPLGTGGAGCGYIWGKDSASAGVLGHEKPLLVVHQAAERVLQSPSSLPDYSFVVFSTKLPQQLHCSSV